MAVSISKRKTKKSETRYRAQVRVPGHRHVSRTFTLRRAAKAWGRKEEDRLKSLTPGSAINRKVSEAIERYEKESLPELKSRVARKRHLEWWSEQIGHLHLFEVMPTHIADCIRLLDDHQAEDRPRGPATIIHNDFIINSMLVVFVNHVCHIEALLSNYFMKPFFDSLLKLFQSLVHTSITIFPLPHCTPFIISFEESCNIGIAYTNFDPTIIFCKSCDIRIF